MVGWACVVARHIKMEQRHKDHVNYEDTHLQSQREGEISELQIIILINSCELEQYHAGETSKVAHVLGANACASPRANVVIPLNHHIALVAVDRSSRPEAG